MVPVTLPHAFLLSVVESVGIRVRHVRVCSADATLRRSGRSFGGMWGGLMDITTAEL
jgi:hypothetical protein